MREPARISAADARRKVKSEDVLLVCAYDDDATFRQMPLEGAISMAEFKSRLSSLSNDKEIIFYCG